MSKRSDNRLVNFFFSLQNQIRVYHWQTNSYARHKATDGFLGKLDDNVDKFMEVYQGKYGKLKIGSNPIETASGHLTDDQSILYLKEAIKFLSSLESEGILSSKDTDLLNIRDEIVGDINQTLYLFTFM